ncbi:MAG: polysaccharide deacetylase family protein [Clostridia bacterium]|nr:polysaccharide deacetylase family protein [Clostridia bacterium]
MWNGKKKAITFSFDDGVTQDIRLIEILDKYGLKCTFNLNSEFLGLEGTLDRNGRTVRHDKIARNKIKEVYKNHEVAVHTLTHPFLPSLDEKEIIRQVENDRQNLSEICGYEVVSMAYPCGGENNDDRVAEIIRNNTGVRLARGLESTYNFDLQDNPLRFKPTVYYIEDCLDEIVDRFLKLDSDKPQLLYIWGHSYEMDAEYISWEKFEEICKRLSGHDDIFYGTNKDVLLDS